MCQKKPPKKVKKRQVRPGVEPGSNGSEPFVLTDILADPFFWSIQGELYILQNQ